MKAVPLLAKTACFAVLTSFAVVQVPSPTEKPTPAAPTINLPLARLKPESTFDIAGDRLMTPADGGIWVSTREAGQVIKIDGKTNKAAEPVAVGKDPCGGLATGFGSLIVPLCGAPGLARVDQKTNAVTVVAKNLSPAMVGPVTGVGSIWIVNSQASRLVRIDPDSNAFVADMPLGAKAVAIAFGQSALWIATGNNELLKINPYTIVTSEIIKVGKAPCSIALGEGAVWTLNSGDATVSRIDTKTNKVAETIKLGAPIAGGQIAAGAGSIWVSTPGRPLIRIDPRTNRISQQFSGEGGGAILVTSDAIWITATPKTIWRLDPKLIDATRH